MYGYALVDFKSIQTGTKTPVFEKEYLKEVAATIKQVGIIALPVVAIKGLDSYELVSGYEIYETVRYLRDELKQHRSWELLPCIIIKNEHRKAALHQIAAVYDTI